MRSQALIIAQPSYNDWDPLPRAAAAASELAQSLAKHGYTLAQLLDGSDKRQAEIAIEDWFAGAPEDARLILLWTGHGSSDNNAHYLVCRTSPRVGLSPFTAIDTSALGTVIANCNADKVLVILDTCYSGKGAADIASVLARVLAARVPVPGRERAVAVIASAHPFEKAQEGLFCNALRSVLFEPNALRLWSDKDERIHSEFLARAVSKLLPVDAGKPEYKADGIGQDFIPNPRYRPGLVAEIVEERLWRLARSGSAEHFDLAARGVEVGQSGWYFAGRTRLLRAIVDWLNTAEHGVRILTGPPGTGKSAVMGRLATLSDSEFSKAAIEAGVVPPVGTVPPHGVIDVAIHAKGKTLDDCARALAQALGIAIGNEAILDIDGVVRDISRIDRRVTIMIDALDEAASSQGGAIAARLIVPIGRLARVRVLIGSRRSIEGTVVPAEQRHTQLRAVFGMDAIIDDLEDEHNTGKDIAEYVRLRLLTSSKHRNDPKGIAVAAERIADKADGVFLYARIVSRTLQEMDRLDGALPATALEAFAHDLQARFGVNERRVDDLLAALAWSEGKGLSRRVWPLVANVLSQQKQPYDDDDVAWVLDHAGWHIIESGEDGQAVYRLGHQALADNYRGRDNPKASQDRILKALTEGIAGAAWLNADRYLWRHLADHAAQAGRLDVLLQDPGYLAVADPTRLLTMLLNVRGSPGRAIADVYIRVVDRLINQPPLERLPLIHLTAQMEAPDLAAILEPPLSGKWRGSWAKVRPDTPHRVVGRHDAAVNCVAFITMDERPIVVSGSDDGSVRFWDARTGGEAGKTLKADSKAIKRFATATLEDSDILFSESGDGALRLWARQMGQPIASPVEAVGVLSITNTLNYDHLYFVRTPTLPILSDDPETTKSIWKLLTRNERREHIEDNDARVIATLIDDAGDRKLMFHGSSDGRIMIWDEERRRSIGELTRPEITAGISLLVLGNIDGSHILISGHADGTVRLWDVERQELKTVIECHTARINMAELGESSGRTLLVTGDDNHIRLWDIKTSRLIGEGPIWYSTIPSSALAFGKLGRRVIAATISKSDDSYRVWDVLTGQQICLNVKSRGMPVESIVVDHNSKAVEAFARKDTIVLVDTQRNQLIGRPLSGHTANVLSLAWGVIDGHLILASGGADRTIRIWYISNEIEVYLKRHPFMYRAARYRSTLHDRWRLRGLHAGAVNSVSLELSKRGWIAISGGNDCAIRTWNATSGKAAKALHNYHYGPIKSVSACSFGGKLLIATAGDDCRALVWDDAFSNVLTHIPELWSSANLGKIKAVIVCKIGGIPTVVSCGRIKWGAIDKGTIGFWDVRTAILRVPRGFLPGEFFDTSAIVVGLMDNRQVLVAGSEDGKIQLWDCRTEERVAESFAAHTGAVTSLDLGLVDGHGIVVSGSRDSTVRVWHSVASRPVGVPIAVHNGAVNSVSLDRAGKMTVVVSGSDDNTIRIASISSQKELLKIDVGTEVISVAFNSDIGVLAGIATGVVLLKIENILSEL